MLVDAEGQAYLAGWRTGNPPHCGYHRQGAGGLVGALLPGRWVIGVGAVTGGEGQQARLGLAEEAEILAFFFSFYPLCSPCSVLPMWPGRNVWFTYCRLIWVSNWQDWNDIMDFYAHVFMWSWHMVLTESVCEWVREIACVCIRVFGSLCVTWMCYSHML